MARIEFRRSTAEEITAEEGTVDFAFANMLVHHADDPLKVIVEMTRILKWGGALVVTDLDEHDSVFLRTEHHDRWMGFSRDAVRSWLEKADLVSVEVRSLNESCCATSSMGERANVSIFVATGRKPLTR